MLVRAKLFLRQAAPGYYRLALLPYVKARRFTQRWRRVAVYANQRANGNIFAIELDITAGFFAVITAYLYILVHCETQNLTPTYVLLEEIIVPHPMIEIGSIIISMS